MIVFEPIEHKYKHKDTGVELTSVSKLISSVKQPFDKAYWSQKKAKDRGITAEEVLAEWDEINKSALAKGTAYHEAQEAKALNGKGIAPLEQDGLKLAHDLSDLAPGFYPELILYNFDAKLAGTADSVWIHEDKWFTIGDFKTNKKLDFKGFMKFDPDTKTRRETKMKSPVSHLADCNGLHYTLQLSIYAYMLESFGYKCRDLYIDHIIFEGDEPVNEVRYPIQYLKREVQSLFIWYKNKKK